MNEARAIGEEMAKSEPQPGRADLLKRYGPIAIIAAGLAFGYLMDWHRFLSLEYLAEQRETLTAHVAAHYPLSLAGFVLLYALAVAFSFPAASVLTIFGGFLFGWWVAGIAVAFGATAGATVLFLAARSAFGDFLRERVGGLAARLADGFREDAFSYLLVLRLAPFFPFFVINIAPALFGVKLRTYVAATFLGILPGCFAYAWLGQGIGSVLVAADSEGGAVALKDLVTPEITIAFIALAVVAIIPTIVRKWRGSHARMRRD
ncbi:MAG: TVP38/TMEM64 family protein [Zhengella sp.]|uniref:TVP38/TMEM64 family protein n=1 Tax=Zhengella sp. TaxID=2282762 RepID=UPI003529722D